MNSPQSIEKTITLCGVQGCCPTVTVSTQEVVLRDDFGGVVRLTPDQWQELKQKMSSQEI